jgi:uncharacterized protein (DUF3084 family)
MKINFTVEHFQRLQQLLLSMLLSNDVVVNKFGQPLNVVELLHVTSIQSLNNIRLNLAKQIENLENQDEWVASPTTQVKLENLKESKELTNLIIGYKRSMQEIAENNAKKAELKAKIAQMKEEAKTPEDRLKEAEAELAAIESPSF